MNTKDLELLQKVLDFLNQVPNRKYGDNYQLVEEFKNYCIRQCTLRKEIKYTLKSLRKDAKWALKDKWDRSDIGFEHQIVYINEMLNKLK